MNIKSIFFYVGLFCFPISILAFVNILYSSYFDYFLSIESYFITLFLSLTLGLGFYFLGKKSNKKINFIDQIILIIFVYLLIGFLISIPFYLSNLQITLVSAFFEAISGVTGTGFTVFKNIKYLDPTLILWRSSSQWIGGLYFLFFLIFLFSNKKYNYKLTNLTYSGESNYLSEENIKNNLLKIFIFYSSISFIFLMLFNFSGIRLFNSLNLTMTTISGGGFLPADNLTEIISSGTQKFILIISLLFSTLNFFLLLNIFSKNLLINKHREDLYILITIIILTLFIYFNNQNGVDIIISVISSFANSGITLMQSDSNLSLYFLLLTIIGGSLISNTSGIKLTRFYILIKITSSEIIR